MLPSHLDLDLDAVDLVRLAFVVAAGGVYLVFFTPAFRSRFLAYGARASSNISSAEQEKRASHKSGNAIETALDQLSTLKVPHSWFISFYAVSVCCSLICAADYVLSGPVTTQFAALTNSWRSSMTFNQVVITWIAVLAQGCRRLYECHAFSRPSKSTMWVGHWAIGLAFYVGLNIAIWIEGARALQKHKLTLIDLSIQTPSFRTFVTLAVFMFASGIQHDCHAYLASLKPTGANNKDGKTDYKLPNHPAFHLTLTPHYFAECIIYLSLAGMAAPSGQWLNGTVSCALLFVAVNLGVTAHGTYDWYRQKFGKESLRGRWRMVPFVF